MGVVSVRTQSQDVKRWELKKVRKQFSQEVYILRSHFLIVRERHLHERQRILNWRRSNSFSCLEYSLKNEETFQRSLRLPPEILTPKTEMITLALSLLQPYSIFCFSIKT